MASQKRKTTKQVRSKAFQATRARNSDSAAEDYSELVADLIRERGEARVGSVAEEMGISHVTALRTIRRLQLSGYLKTSPHKPIELTPKGKKTAAFSKERHELLLEFFLRIGVPRKVAEIDVEGAEHYVSPETLKYLRKFLRRG